MVINKEVVIEAWRHLEKLSEELLSEKLSTDLKVVQDKLMELQMASTMAVHLLDKFTKQQEKLDASTINPANQL